MKVKTLSVLAGIGVPLILAAPSDAGLVGVTWTAKPNAFNLYVVNVYAEFDNPGGDWIHKAGGTPVNPMNINVIGGEFYNHPGGTDQAPTAFIVGIAPSAAYDSFYTIGRKILDPAGATPNALNLVNMPVLAGTAIGTVNGSWALIPPTALQGNPFDPINSFPGNGSVLIGQYSMEIPADGPYGITGEFFIGYVSDGIGRVSHAGFSAMVPAPGALALVGLAGLLSPRRRRR